jgi:hypothetical protein
VPVHGLAIEPKRRGDEQRLHDILQQAGERRPLPAVEHAASTNETVVYGLGELHLRTLLDRLTEVHNCQVETRPPRIAYRETVTRSRPKGHHRHKKQTGGAGQFGEVFLRIEPLPRGSGFQFVDEVKGGAIPHNFMPAVEKGVRLAMEQGVIAGYPVVDLKVIVYDGKHHTVDSKEIAFVQAGKKALVAAGAGGAALPAGAHRQRGDRRAGAAHGRHHRRPGFAPRAGERHAGEFTGCIDGAGDGAAVGAGQLPVAAEFTDGRTGSLHAVVDCQYACPAHTPVPEYIRLIAQRRYSDAYMVNWASNVFPGILGAAPATGPASPPAGADRVEEAMPSSRSRWPSAASSARPPT